VDGFQDKAAVEAPGEGAEVARQMFGGDHSVGGEQAVLDIGEHGVRPAEGRVACSSAIGAGDVALMDDTFGPRQVRTRLLAGGSGIRTLGPQHSRRCRDSPFRSAASPRSAGETDSFRERDPLPSGSESLLRKSISVSQKAIWIASASAGAKAKRRCASSCRRDKRLSRRARLRTGTALPTGADP